MHAHPDSILTPRELSLVTVGAAVITLLIAGLVWLATHGRFGA